MKSIQARLNELEKHAGVDGQQMTWIVSFVSPGPDGPVHRDPIGYTTAHYGDGVRWDRQPGETLDNFKERVTREVPRNATGATVLIECYSGDALAA